MLSEVWKRGEFEFVDIHKRMSNIYGWNIYVVEFFFSSNFEYQMRMEQHHNQMERWEETWIS